MSSARLEEEIENSRVFDNHQHRRQQQQQEEEMILAAGYQQSSLALLDGKNISEKYKKYAAGGNKMFFVVEQQGGKEYHHDQQQRLLTRDYNSSRSILDNYDENATSTSVTPPTTFKMISSVRRKSATAASKVEHDCRGFPPLHGPKKCTPSSLTTTANPTRQEIFFSQEASGPGHNGTDCQDESYCIVGHSKKSKIIAGCAPFWQHQEQLQKNSSFSRSRSTLSRLNPPLLPEKSMSSSSKLHNLAPNKNQSKLLRTPQDSDASSLGGQQGDSSLARHLMDSTFSSFGGSSSSQSISSTKSFTTYSSSFSSSIRRFHRKEKVDDEERNDNGQHDHRNLSRSNTSESSRESPPHIEQQDLIKTASTDRRVHSDERNATIHDRLAKTKTKSMDLRLKVELTAKEQKERQRHDSRGRPAFYVVANSSSFHSNSNVPIPKSPFTGGTRSASPRKHFYRYLTETETVSSAYRKGLATPTKGRPAPKAISMDLRPKVELSAKEQRERQRHDSRGRPAFYVVANSSSFHSSNSNVHIPKSPSTITRSASPRKHFYRYLTETETVSSAFRKGLATPTKECPAPTTSKMSSRNMEALCTRLANQDTVASSKRIVPTPNRKPMMANYEVMKQADELERKRYSKSKVRKDFFDILAVEKTKSTLFREIETLKSGSFRE